MEVGEIADGEQEDQQEQDSQGELRSCCLIDAHSPAVVGVFPLLGEGRADQKKDPAEK